MASSGDELVRRMSRQVASEQGGTNHVSADAAAARSSPSKLASEDVASASADEDAMMECCDEDGDE